MGKKIIVTGGAGFIGSHICKRLINEGNIVLCVDNLFTGNMDNIKELMDNPSFSFMNHDITVPFDAEADQIYNLACPASPVHYQYDPIHTMKTCTVGVLNMLELAKKNDARLLQSSTSEVYGNPLVHPQVESYHGNVNPIGIRSCYDEGKRAAETLIFDFHRRYKTEVRVARIFNTYGPNMQENDGRVVSNFIIQALNNKDITLYGDGSQTRSFCYVSDLVDGLIRLMNCDNTGPINLGNPCEMTVKQLAELIIEMTGSDSTVIHESLPPDDPTKRKPCIDLANEVLGWQPVVLLADGLKDTITYFKSRI